MEISSRFTSHEFVSTFRKVIKVSGSRDENRVVVDPMRKDEYVTIGTFVRFRCGEGCPELMFDKSGKPLFPFYWYPAPWLIRGTRVERLNEYEREAAKFLARFKVMGSSDLIARKTNSESLGEYMFSMSTLSDELVIDESSTKGSKRQNQEEPRRIIVEIPKRKKVATAEEEGYGLEEPLKRKRMPRSRGLPPPFFGGSSQSQADLETVTKEASPSITCCSANPSEKKKRGDSPPSFLTKEFDSLSYVDEGFKKYGDPSSLSNVSSDDLRKAAMDHHIQGAMLSYFLSARQELEVIEAKNKMKVVDEHLGSLEKEYATTKTKLEEDLKELKATRDEEVKKVVGVKENECVKEWEVYVGEVKALKEEVKTKGEQLASAIKARDAAISQRDELIKERNAITNKASESRLPRARREQVGRAGCPELDYKIVDGKIVPFTLPGAT
ncbi:hypothetical protein TSUD_372710 [Trifolium subterraneum]|uniref:Uncharacterized protein n=1 Tax=Trifolium subterraneum TaxID=3900 RepID=A0A2Z6N5Z0_TRISU|nr:hypothetical protein TSUD_372710 [Trifolium subterraneum]